MLNRTHILAVILLGLVALMAPDVQAQKIGYTNQEAILANMPEMEQVQQQLQQEAQRQQEELQREQQQFQQRMQRYQQQQSLLSDSVRAQREQELRQMQSSLQQSLQNREQQLQQRELELMQPLLEELQSAINDVAGEQSIDVVLRTQAMLYVDQESQSVVNITDDVAAKLGIDLSDTETAPAPTVDSDSGPATPNGQ